MLNNEEILSNLRNIFLQETLVIFAEIEKVLLNIQQASDRSEQFSILCRIFQSLKSSAASIGFTELSQFANKVEEILVVFKINPSLCEARHLNLLVECCDMLKKWLYALNLDPKYDFRVDVLDAKLKNTISELDLAASNLQIIPENTAKDLPESAKLGDLLIVLGNASAGDIVWASEEQKKWQQKNSNKKLGEVLVEKGVCKAVEIERALKIQTILRESIQDKTNPNKDGRNQSVKIDTDRIENILNLVGELVVIKSQIMQDPILKNLREQKISALLLLLDKTVRELQENSLALRMTSLKSTFMKVQRTVRELSERLNKTVELNFYGDETELDRGIVELLTDPLMHICRNSIDHGFEHIEDRIKLGKPEKAKLSLSAGRQGGRIYIDITDDGRGIDKEKVFAKAKQQNLLPQDAQIDKYPDKNIYEFLFIPGFSTAEQVTEVSGRGVGMDVVRNNLEKMKGSIEINSKINEGTHIRLWIPLTMAITDAMLLQVCGNTYVLPTEVICELIHPEDVKIYSKADIKSTINVRGSILPLIKLKNALGLEEHPSDIANNSKEVIIVVEENKFKVALMVDAVLGQSQVVVKGLSSALSGSRGIGGAAILGDGKVGLILDIGELVHHKNHSNYLEFNQINRIK